MSNYQPRQSLPRLHYVTQGATPAEHLKYVKQVCQAGCPWVQLRLKEVSNAVYRATAAEALAICRQYGALLTINDSVETAVAIQADGIHVGKTDLAPALVRQAYPEAIIGATANTWEDIQRLLDAPIDYIGLGPLRFTATKKKLSPILGRKGYQLILQKMADQGSTLPILAIGGVQEQDVAVLREMGIWGVAISGLLTQSNEKQELVKRILE